MSFRKRSLLLALVIAVVTLTSVIFASCSVAKSKKPVTVTWWHIGTAANDLAFNQGLADAYMKDHPNVTIEITVLENEAFKSKLTTVMQSGTPPDIFHSWGGGVLAEYAKAGLLRDITKFTKGTDWGKSMASGVWEIYGYDGKQYGAPTDMGAITFWYNTDLLAKAGYTTFPTDWDDFIACVKKLKANGVTPIALGGGDKWPAMHMWTYLALRIGGKEAIINATKGTGKGFNDPAFLKAGDMLVELVKLGAFQDGFLGATYADEAALVGNGVAAMELMGQWAPNVEKDSSISKAGIGDLLGAAPVPSVKGGLGKVTDVIGGGNGYAMGKNASDAAVDFLKFITNLENNAQNARISSIIPTVKGAEIGIQDNNGKMVKKIVDQTEFYQLYLDQFFSPAVGGAVNDAVQTILAGTATPAQASAAIQAAFDADK